MISSKGTLFGKMLFLNMNQSLGRNETKHNQERTAPAAATAKCVCLNQRSVATASGSRSWASRTGGFYHMVMEAEVRNQLVPCLGAVAGPP